MWQRVEKGQVPAYRQITKQVTQAIQSGQLQPGQRLPSERELAKEFQVNRSTVVHAFNELTDIGIIISRQGSGRYVNQTDWGKLILPRVDWRKLITANFLYPKNTFSEKVKEARKNNHSLTDLYSSELPKELLPLFVFPQVEWSALLSEEQRQDRYGYGPLREQIAALLTDRLNSQVEKQQLLITAGGQQAIFLILQTLLNEGEAIAVESPSFFYQLPLFQATGTKLFGLPMDEEGIDLLQLEQMILTQRIRLVMVNPTFQNPTGIVMSVARRNELIELCRKYHLPLIEDDVFADLAFKKNHPSFPALKQLDPDNVLFIGSLSTVLGRTTKIGWIWASETILEQLASAQKMMDTTISILPQLAASSILSENYEEKIQTLMGALEERKQFLNSWHDSQTFFHLQAVHGGYYAWLTWDGKPLDTSIATECLNEGLAIAPAFLFGSQENGLRVNFSRLTEKNLADFEKGMKYLERRLTE